jgi:hypothetical protein
MSAHRDPSINDIELEIARTRGRLGHTVDALAMKLAPQNLVREGVEVLNKLLSRRDPVNLGDRLRVDPAALGLIGLGVAWLVAENAGLLDRVIPRNREPAASTNPPVGAVSIEQPGIGHGEGNHRGGWFHQAANSTKGALHSVYDRSGAVIGQASEPIADPSDSGQKVRQAAGQVLHAVERNPLLLGLAGVAAGMAIAMLLPVSRPEREIATQAREGMWETAEEIGHRAAATISGMAADQRGDREGLPHEPRNKSG